MCRLLETIKVKDGKLQDIDFHNDRFNRSREVLFCINEKLNLENLIQLNSNLSNGIYKCRIIYGKSIQKIEFLPYFLPEIKSLKIVVDNSIDYAFKYENRDNIHKLLLQKGKCDDILIIKNGFVTDTSYSNIAFNDGERLFTSNTPLLKGTKRAKLIAQGLLSETEIKLSDIKLFKTAFLINAMIDLDDKIEISTNKII
ncbi:MAG: aminotransferase class IV [Bacteroidetes bacterium]|nr:aminotransferase class IV [Bacteroidota bacterium]